MDKEETKMSVRIPKGTYASLKQLAKKDGRTIQGYVSRLLNTHTLRKAAQEEE